jgi:hypothetical protein
MARGWESKSVEEQMAESQQSASVALDGSEGQKHSMALEKAARERQLQELELQREHILSQRTSSPARRAALEVALTDIETRIAGLGL